MILLMMMLSSKNIHPRFETTFLKVTAKRTVHWFLFVFFCRYFFYDIIRLEKLQNDLQITALNPFVLHGKHSSFSLTVNRPRFRFFGVFFSL